MNIVSHFYSQTEHFPQKTAIISKEGSITYIGLLEKVDGKAAYFLSKGIGKGDRVLIFSSMNTNLYASLLALFKIGAVAVIVDKWASVNRIRNAIKVSECKGILASGKLKYLSFLFKETRSIKVRLSLKKEFKNQQNEICKTSDDHPALITFTTGSTNQPKATVRTHRFLTIQFETIIEAKGSNTDDIELIHLPILLMLNLASGSTSYIPQVHKRDFNRSNWKKIEKEIDRYGVNTMTCSPAFLESMCRQTKTNNQIKSIFCGGGSVYPSLANLAINHFPFSESYVVYGATEAEPISIGNLSVLANSDVLENEGLYVGRLSKGIEVFIDKSVTSSTFLFGEILVKGNHVLDNYLNNLGRTQNKKEIEGVLWHRTGDLGFIKEGVLFFTGRLHQWIKDEKLSPLLISSIIKDITDAEGVMIQKHGRRIVCTEPFDHSKEHELSEVLYYDELKVVKSLPRDPRHQTKVDYAEIIRRC